MSGVSFQKEISKLFTNKTASVKKYFTMMMEYYFMFQVPLVFWKWICSILEWKSSISQKTVPTNTKNTQDINIIVFFCIFWFCLSEHCTLTEMCWCFCITRVFFLFLWDFNVIEVSGPQGGDSSSCQLWFNNKITQSKVGYVFSEKTLI